MNTYQIPLIHIDRLIKLNEVERVLSRIFAPAPSRPTIITWLEDGTLEGKQIGRGDNYYVYESSLNQFIESVQKPQGLAA